MKRRFPMNFQLFAGGGASGGQGDGAGASGSGNQTQTDDAALKAASGIK